MGETTMPETEKTPVTNANTVGAYMNQEDIQHMAGAFQSVGQWIIMGSYAESRAGRCQKLAEEKEAEQFTTCLMMIERQRWQQGV